MLFEFYPKGVKCLSYVPGSGSISIGLLYGETDYFIITDDYLCLIKSKDLSALYIPGGGLSLRGFHLYLPPIVIFCDIEPNGFKYLSYWPGSGNFSGGLL